MLCVFSSLFLCACWFPLPAFCGTRFAKSFRERIVGFRHLRRVIVFGCCFIYVFKNSWLCGLTVLPKAVWKKQPLVRCAFWKNFRERTFAFGPCVRLFLALCVFAFLYRIALPKVAWKHFLLVRHAFRRQLSGVNFGFLAFVSSRLFVVFRRCFVLNCSPESRLKNDLLVRRALRGQARPPFYLTPLSLLLLSCLLLLGLARVLFFLPACAQAAMPSWTAQPSTSCFFSLFLSLPGPASLSLCALCALSLHLLSLSLSLSLFSLFFFLCLSLSLFRLHALHFSESTTLPGTVGLPMERALWWCLMIVIIIFNEEVLLYWGVESAAGTYYKGPVSGNSVSQSVSFTC